MKKPVLEYALTTDLTAYGDETTPLDLLAIGEAYRRVLKRRYPNWEVEIMWENIPVSLLWKPWAVVWLPGSDKPYHVHIPHDVIWDEVVCEMQSDGYNMPVYVTDEILRACNLAWYAEAAGGTLYFRVYDSDSRELIAEITEREIPRYFSSLVWRLFMSTKVYSGEV